MKRFLCAMLCIALAFACIPSASAQVYVGQQPPAAWKNVPTLRLTALDVDQGDALLLECGGEAMMIDGGPDVFRGDVKAAIDARGIESFKYLLTTHYHDDHINGLYRLMQYGYAVGEYLHPYSDFYVRKDKLQSRAVKEAQKHGIPVRRVFDGDSLTLGAARLTLYRHTDIQNGNAKSLVTHVSFGDSTMLLAADIIGKTQAYFAQTLPPETLDVDMVKVPHHGVTAMNPAFADATSPAFALITSQQKRLKEGASQLEGRGIPYLCSGDGAVVLETDGDDWYIHQLP